MSTLKRISPMLDGFVFGEAVSNHDGIRCYPAIEKETGKKYIIKVISVPASQTNLDALLLAGAFADQKAALGYFKELADETVEDAALLQKLSRQEGFVAYENWQIVPKDSGFDIYLLGAYQATLERFFEKEFMTHLRAVNLGLDLCAALSECRRRGYLYVNLKPENVAITEDGEYRICDLGFVKLDSLVYASLPEKYRSSYTAPEMKDAYDALNKTLDTYAVGMILYQAYNNGILPFAGQAPAEVLAPPAYADNEMAQIILKACAPNPEDRWEDPVQMGQALVSYMQRTAVNDTPIAPLPQKTEVPVAEEPVAEVNQEVAPADDILAEADLLLNALAADEAAEVAVEEESAEELAEETVEEEPAEEAVEETIAEEPAEEAAEETIEEEPAEEAAEEIVQEEPAEKAAEEVIEEEPAEEPAEEIVQEKPAEEPAEEIVEEEPAEKAAEEVIEEEPAEEPAEDDIDAILAQADALIAHELPKAVVVPQPIAVEIPQIDRNASAEEINEEETVEEESAEEAVEEEPAEETIEEESVGEESVEEEPAEETVEEESVEEKTEEEPVVIIPTEEKPKRKRIPAFLAWLPVLILFSMCLVLGNYIFYNQYYIQTINNLTLSGFENQLTVTIRSQIDDDKLTVFCSDTYGNTLQSSVEKGKATFENLQPDTRYQVYVEIEGFHKLVGVVEDVYTTPNTTSVTNISAITGSEDGSIILNFGVVGDDSAQWTVFYQAEGEKEQSLTFSGHTITITGLTVGKTYTFRMEPVTDLYMVGDNTFTYTASQVIYAQNLIIESASGGKLVATWEIPEGVTVESWTVYCYNDGDYKKTITVTEPKAVFEDLDFATEYTVEVTAAGMTQSVRTYISPNPITIGQVTFDDSDPNKLTISWEYEGNAPEEGWLLLYTINSSATQHITAKTNNVTLNTRIPGCTYNVTIQTIDGYTVFGSDHSYQAPEAKTFEGYGLKAKYMKFEMCVPPNSGKWTKADLAKKDYTTSFAVGSKAAFAVTLTEEYNTSPDIIVTLFVIRDAEGNIVLTGNSQSRTWTSMWYKGFGRILVPVLPDTAGQYSMEIYLNGMLVHAQKFEMT